MTATWEQPINYPPSYLAPQTVEDVLQASHGKSLLAVTVPHIGSELGTSVKVLKTGRRRCCSVRPLLPPMPFGTAAYEGEVRLGRPLLEAWLADAGGSGGM